MTAHLDPVSILAPAKVNLTLHVTGRRRDGYHTLHSLVAFADIGDHIHLTLQPGFSFSVTGPFAGSFGAAEIDQSASSRNLAVRAAYGFFDLTERDPSVHVQLSKNLPLAAGLGGGSADAAAVIWGLCQMFRMDPQNIKGLPELLLSLGADVPACFDCRAVTMEGIGEKLSPAADLPEDIPVILVNPGIPCPTPDVFRTFDLARHATPPSASWMQGRNDLTAAAAAIVPEISFVLQDIATYPGCRVARLSGSGATCFGVFTDRNSADAAAKALNEKHPHWWVRAGFLNSVERY